MDARRRDLWRSISGCELPNALAARG